MSMEMTAKSLVAVMMIVSIFICGCEENDPNTLVKRTDYDIPEHWEIKTILGRKLYYRVSFPYAREVIMKFKDCAMFKAMWNGVSDKMRINDFHDLNRPVLPKDRPYTNFPVRIDEVLQKCFGGWKRDGIYDFEKLFPGMPFSIGSANVAPPFRLQDHFDMDIADYQAWKKQHPTFMGFGGLDEYDHDEGGFLYQRNTCTNPVMKARLARDYVPDIVDGKLDRRQRRRWTDKNFAKARAFWWGEQNLDGLWSIWLNTGHDLARAGCSMITLETECGSVAAPYTWSGAFGRGAARQYDKLFGYYTAVLSLYSVDRNGKTSPEVESFMYWPQPAWPNRKPYYGISRSLLKRSMAYGMFIGANALTIEGGMGLIGKLKGDGTKDVELSENGKDLDAIFAWAHRHDRGTVYAPVAYLASIDESLNRQFYDGGGQGCNDMASHAGFLFTLTPTKGALTSNTYLDPKNGKQGCMWNSEFGEIYDAICPDGEQTTDVLLKVLKGYKAAFLVGSFDKRYTDIAAIERYVHDGGTLFIPCDKVMEGFFTPEFAGVTFSGEKVKGTGAVAGGHTLYTGTATTAKPRCLDDAGVPVAYAHDLGQGRVVTVAIKKMLPDSVLENPREGWFDGKLRKIVRGQIKFPVIAHFLREVQRETMPVCVDGDIQWGCNKTEKGWLVWLLNNNGVTKYNGEPEVLDPAATSAVKILHKKSGKVYTATVTAGDWQVVEIEE
ncbi:MAG: hypothetical protein PHV28_05640 [Kiritimatiellae bacterium]|nr:hypothetical protein [Kiritimatiellia bacterium]